MFLSHDNYALIFLRVTRSMEIPVFFPRKGNVNIKKFLRLRNSTGWINLKYRRKTVKEIKGNTSCSLQGSKEKIKLFIWLNRFPSYVIGFQRRFGGMRDESKNGGGMQDDRNFNSGMQYKKNKLLCKDHLSKQQRSEARSWFRSGSAV